MRYFIRRQQAEYGPYTLAELQRYVASGNILLTDLARSEAMTEWVPVSQVLGNIPTPAMPPTPPAPAAGGYVAPVATPGQVYGQPQGGYVQPGGYVAPAGGGYGTVPVASGVPNPPNLHWGLVLLFWALTCGLFGLVWFIIEAAWVKRIKPQSKGLLFACLGVGAYVVSSFMSVANNMSGYPEVGIAGFAFLLAVAAFVLFVVGAFQMRSDIEHYYNTVEPINLRLSGVMTFFFAVFYFQHHFTRINEWKKTGQLQPQ